MRGSTKDESADEVRICGIHTGHVADLIHIGDTVGLSPWTAENYLDELKNPDSVMLRLVSIDNKTLGFVVGGVVGWPDDGADGGLEFVAVCRWGAG